MKPPFRTDCRTPGHHSLVIDSVDRLATDGKGSIPRVIAVGPRHVLESQIDRRRSGPMPSCTNETAILDRR